MLQQTAAPAFFQLSAGNRSYVAGTHAEGSYLAGPALVQSGIPGTPAKPGEIIVLFGTGFGATNPRYRRPPRCPRPLPLGSSGKTFASASAGSMQPIAFAGLISPGLYQFNVVVPQVDDGDVPVIAELRGLLTRPDLLLSVKR